MSLEARRQAALLQAILRGEPQGLAELGALGVGAGSLALGLRAYRGNAIALAERVLAGAYPQLAQHLGSAFASLAWSFWRQHPPRCGDLGEWGDELPAFLRESADDALTGLASLEWALHQAERAEDATLDAGSLQCLQYPPDGLCLQFRPGLCLLDLPAPALALLGGYLKDMMLPGGGASTVLVWRKAWRGRAARLQTGTAAFLRSALAGHSIETALDAARLADGDDLDFTALLQQALQEQWLMAVLRRDPASATEQRNPAHPKEDVARHIPQTARGGTSRTSPSCHAKQIPQKL